MRREAREVRRTHREAGKLVARFTLRAGGSVADDEPRTLRIRFAVPEPATVTAEDVPADVAPNAARIAAAAQRGGVENMVGTILADLNSRRAHLEQPQQAQLCAGRNGRTTERFAFRFFRDKATADLVVTSDLRRVVNEAFGPRCEEINCDCRNIEAGILTAGWRSQCRGEQAAAIRRCRETGQVQGCHMTGPNPRYPR